jgi:peptidoglycan/xylan/chitin deacetylase (PgdA/CDA1 family)
LKLIKVILSNLLYCSGILYLLNNLWGKGVTRILSFHRIVDNPSQAQATPSLPYLTASDFDQLVQYLKGKYSLLTLTEWVSGNLKKTGVILTFDDGWEDNYTYAFPVLKKHGVTALIYLAVGFVGTQREFWQVRLSRLMSKLSLADLKPTEDQQLNQLFESALKKPADPKSMTNLTSYLKARPGQEILDLLAFLEEKSGGRPGPKCLDWQQIAEMQKAGISFGSHTLNHLILTTEDQETVTKELELSKKSLEEKLNQPVYHFAYPDGAYNQKLKPMVKEAGYQTAATIKEDLNPSGADRFELNRIEMEENKVTGLSGRFSKQLYELETCWLYLRLRNWLKSK